LSPLRCEKRCPPPGVCRTHRLSHRCTADHDARVAAPGRRSPRVQRQIRALRGMCGRVGEELSCALHATSRSSMRVSNPIMATQVAAEADARPEAASLGSSDQLGTCVRAEPAPRPLRARCGCRSTTSAREPLHRARLLDLKQRLSGVDSGLPPVNATDPGNRTDVLLIGWFVTVLPVRRPLR
jgi:hypothetical protein